MNVLYYAMPCFRKLLSLLGVLVFLATQACAQDPVEWTQFHGIETSTRVLVDSQNNVHRLMVTGPAGFLQSYNRFGHQVWTTSLGFTGTADKAITHAEIVGNFLLVSSRTTSAPYSSFVSLFNVLARETVWAWSGDQRRVEQFHGNNGVYATVEQLDQSVAVVFRSANTGNPKQTVTLPNSRRLLGSDQDTGGNVYVVTKAVSESEVRLFRVNPNGVVGFQRLLTPAPNPYDSLWPKAIAVNPSTQRVLVMISAFQSPPGLRPILVYDAPWSTGLGTFHTVAFRDEHTPQQILPLPDGDYVVSAYSFSDNPSFFLPNFHIARYTGSTQRWHLETFFSESMYRGIALSNDNTFSVNKTEGHGLFFQTQVVERRSLDTGSRLWGAFVDGTAAEDEPPATAPTGSMIVSGSRAMVHQLRGVVATFPVTHVPGGTTVSLSINLTADAPTGGATVRLVSFASELVVPAEVTIPAGQRQAILQCATSGTTVNKSAVVNVRWAGFATQVAVTLLAPNLLSVTVDPRQVTGGQALTGTVAVGAKAPAGGWEIELMASPPVVTLPTSVVIPEGSTSATFGVTTQPVGANTGVVITATRGSVSKTVFFAVNAPLLSTFTLASNSVQGGTLGSLTVTLNANAPTAGYSILLVSGAPGLVVLPSSTSVPAGTNTRTLSFVTKPVAASTVITLVAYRGSVIKTQSLTLTP